MSQTIIEVILVKNKEKYVATAKLFPKAKGVGLTKKDALKGLANSISKLISKLINSTLSSAFESDSYTEIMFDQSEDSNKEHLAFNISGVSNSIPKSFLFKLSSFSDESDDEFQIEEEDSMLNEGFELSAKELKPYSLNDEYDQIIQQNISNNDPESYVFGFPLSFN